MIFHIITIFPESFESYFGSSIMKKAQENKLFDLQFYKLNDFSENKTKRVDDKAFGMHGQVLSPEPLKNALESIFERIGKKVPVFFLSPSGDTLHQEKVETYYRQISKVGECIIICGHYEGIDERIIELYVDEKISIGEYVLSSGELSASVFIDALVRHIPGVLGNVDSLEEESFSKKLNRQKEYPVYTRPQVFEGKKVPEVLTSGNHKEIEKWKIENLR